MSHWSVIANAATVTYTTISGNNIIYVSSGAWSNEAIMISGVFASYSGTIDRGIPITVTPAPAPRKVDLGPIDEESNRKAAEGIIEGLK